MKFVLAPFAFAAFAAGAAPAPNLVVNPDFETRDAEGHAVGWERLPSNYKVADNAGENGSRGLVFENDDPDRYQLPVQKVPCEPGAEYRFSARLKTEKLINVKGQDPCATVCLQWSDAEGREFGGKYVQGIFDTQGEWRTVECHSARIPTNAVEVRFSPYVTRGVTGRACFDGITLSPVVRQPVAGLWSSAYRDCAAEGKVTFVAGLDLAGAGLKLTDMLPLFRIYLADGKTKDFAPELFTDDEARFTCDVSALPRGKSAVVFELRERRTGRVVKDGQALVVFDRAEKLPARKVWFDASNRLIVDGKPFFPLGMYMNMAITGAVLDVYAKGPFNCLMNYTAPDEKAVDICWKHGLKVLYPMPSAYAGEAFATDIDADA